MSLSRLVFAAFLIGLLLLAGVAQAQRYNGGTNSQNIETKTDGKYLQPYQPCLNADQEGIKGPLQEDGRQPLQTVIVPQINQPNSKDKTKKATEVEYSNHKSNSSGPSLGKSRGTIKQNMGQQESGVASLSMQSGALGSSFLDGYLLKSLQDKEIGRKNATKEKESKDYLPQKRVKKAY